MILLVGAALFAFFAIGTWFWRAPLVGLIGSLGGCAPGWLIVFGTLIAVLTVIDGVTEVEVIAAALAVFTAASGLYFTIDQWRALRRHSVHARLWDFFALIPRSGSGPDDIVTYGPVQGRTPRMAIYRAAPGDSPAPVVLNIHGGAWADGNESSDTALSRALADRGFLVFSATYTLATADLQTWDIAPREIAGAMETAHRLSAQYGGSTSRFYVTGSSAGGHLATLVANRISAGDDLGAGCGPLPTIGAVAVNIAAVDPSIHNPYWKVGDVARRICKAFVGGPPDEFPERYAQVISANFLHPAAPPTLLTYGPNDWLVPCQGTLDYARRAEGLGVEAATVAIPWTGHLVGLSGAGRRAIVQLTIDWFDRHAG
ncbi:MAG: alpha/beta hydrolase [Ilumatobacteraceae bacterium]